MLIIRIGSRLPLPRDGSLFFGDGGPVEQLRPAVHFRASAIPPSAARVNRNLLHRSTD